MRHSDRLDNNNKPAPNDKPSVNQNGHAVTHRSGVQV